jgi:hypothetical protein
MAEVIYFSMASCIVGVARLGVNDFNVEIRLLSTIFKV